MEHLPATMHALPSSSHRTTCQPAQGSSPPPAVTTMFGDIRGHSGTAGHELLERSATTEQELMERSATAELKLLDDQPARFRLSLQFPRKTPKVLPQDSPPATAG